jgi:hypothetical protein
MGMSTYWFDPIGVTLILLALLGQGLEALLRRHCCPWRGF